MVVTSPKGDAMADPMFFYAGVYANAADAEADYEAVKELHGSKAIGSYDAAIVEREMDGDVRVTKTEKPVKHGAWAGVAAGAGAAVLFPFVLPGIVAAGAAGGGLGAWMAHLAHGTSRADAKAVGEALEPGGAALVVIGISEDWSQLEAAVTRAQRHVLQHQFGNWHEAEREAMAAILANKEPAS
jgi:uncharacterized membrane protein